MVIKLSEEQAKVLLYILQDYKEKILTESTSNLRDKKAWLVGITKAINAGLDEENDNEI